MNDDYGVNLGSKLSTCYGDGNISLSDWSNISLNNLSAKPNTYNYEWTTVDTDQINRAYNEIKRELGIMHDVQGYVGDNINEKIDNYINDRKTEIGKCEIIKYKIKH